MQDLIALITINYLGWNGCVVGLWLRLEAVEGAVAVFNPLGMNDCPPPPPWPVKEEEPDMSCDSLFRCRYAESSDVNNSGRIR